MSGRGIHNFELADAITAVETRSKAIANQIFEGTGNASANAVKHAALTLLLLKLKMLQSPVKYIGVVSWHSNWKEKTPLGRYLLDEYLRDAFEEAFTYNEAAVAQRWASKGKTDALLMKYLKGNWNETGLKADLSSQLSDRSVRFSLVPPELAAPIKPLEDQLSLELDGSAVSTRKKCALTLAILRLKLLGIDFELATSHLRPKLDPAERDVKQAIQQIAKELEMINGAAVSLTWHAEGRTGGLVKRLEDGASRVSLTLTDAPPMTPPRGGVGVTSGSVVSGGGPASVPRQETDTGDYLGAIISVIEISRKPGKSLDISALCRMMCTRAGIDPKVLFPIPTADIQAHFAPSLKAVAEHLVSEQLERMPIDVAVLHRFDPLVELAKLFQIGITRGDGRVIPEVIWDYKGVTLELGMGAGGGENAEFYPFAQWLASYYVEQNPPPTPPRVVAEGMSTPVRPTTREYLSNTVVRHVKPLSTPGAQTAVQQALHMLSTSGADEVLVAGK